MTVGKKALKIVFMGTPGFAVPSLEILISNGYNVVGVVTVADKPAGRGYKLQESEVKKSAVKHGIKVMQPTDLKDSEFIADLNSLGTNLIVVVAFRKMPKEVWGLPELGTFNLHGSILPNYRGAAPLNWALINGEKETGVTTFFLDEKIDTGELIDHAKIKIGKNHTVGDVHDVLMEVGAKLVLKTVQSIEKGEVKAIPQSEVNVKTEIKKAPKIFKATCEVSWGKSGNMVHNLIRGLSPYPAAFSTLSFPNGKKMKMKLFKSEYSDGLGEQGSIETDQKTFLKVYCGDGAVNIIELQPEGKKRMKTTDFLRGKDLTGCCFI
ncbi:MAG: methionyl-tRNA formyltransferase [Saprospiraceae bacterium]|jgi:methionyl-tRNA formyltransferase